MHGPALDDHAPSSAHASLQALSHIWNISPSLWRHGLGVTEGLRPPMKCMRGDNDVYPGFGGAEYSPPRRGVGIRGGRGTWATTNNANGDIVSRAVPARSRAGEGEGTAGEYGTRGIIGMNMDRVCRCWVCRQVLVGVGIWRGIVGMIRGHPFL